MFEKLRRRWGVGPGRVVLILCTFALGGSVCGWAARKAMLWLDVDGGIFWWLLYLFIVSLLWPLSVLLISILLGQYGFFRQYIARLFYRMGIGKKEKRSIVHSKSVTEHSLKDGQ